MLNSNRALQSLCETYGTVFTNTEQESVNWNAVRRSGTAKLQATIHSGGLALTKSKSIMAILDKVFAEANLADNEDDETEMEAMSLEHLRGSARRMPSSTSSSSRALV